MQLTSPLLVSASERKLSQYFTPKGESYHPDLLPSFVNFLLSMQGYKLNPASPHKLLTCKDV